MSGARRPHSCFSVLVVIATFVLIGGCATPDDGDEFSTGAPNPNEQAGDPAGIDCPTLAEEPATVSDPLLDAYDAEDLAALVTQREGYDCARFRQSTFSTIPGRSTFTRSMALWCCPRRRRHGLSVSLGLTLPKMRLSS